MPTDAEQHSQAIALAVAVAVLDALGIARAHIVGLSMGAFAAVHFGLRHPDRALSLTVPMLDCGGHALQRDRHWNAITLQLFDANGSAGSPA